MMKSDAVDTAEKVATLGPAADRAAGRLRHLRPGLASIATFILDVAFPPSCPVCHAATERQGGLCPRCWRGIGFIERPFCERLGTPFAQDLGDGLLSAEVMADPPAFRRARAVARFDDGPVRVLVHRLKYGDRMELARPIAEWMARAGSDLLADADLVVAVPLHRRRLWLRRFNQAAALAEAVARIGGVRHRPFGLERVKATASQVGMTRTQRLANLQGAFRVPAAAAPEIEGRTVLLIDDVLTTGATLNAAARALLRAGAAQVDVLVFARVIRTAV